MIYKMTLPFVQFEVVLTKGVVITRVFKEFPDGGTQGYASYTPEEAYSEIIDRCGDFELPQYPGPECDFHSLKSQYIARANDREALSVYANDEIARRRIMPKPNQSATRRAGDFKLTGMTFIGQSFFKDSFGNAETETTFVDKKGIFFSYTDKVAGGAHLYDLRLIPPTEIDKESTLILRGLESLLYSGFWENTDDDLSAPATMREYRGGELQPFRTTVMNEE